MASSEQEARRVRRERYHEADIVIVGAGIFGCAAAFAFANQGRSIILLEKSMAEPDRIVGELLQPGGLAALRKLGLGHCVEDIDSIPCAGYNVVYHGEPSLVSYPPLDQSGQVERRWGGAATEGQRQTGRAFHHGRFIMQLRRSCLAHPNITVVEAEATALVHSDVSSEVLGVQTVTTDPDTRAKTPGCYFGALTIVADGYNSPFRKKHLPDATPVSRSKFYALELIDCPLPRPGYAMVIIGDKFPILLYQIGGRETRALFDVPVNLPEASPAQGGVRGYLTKYALPAMPEGVRKSAEAALSDGKIPRSMPNSWLPPSKQLDGARNGFLLLGDAMNMRHPLTGGGMTVAFNDVVLLTDLLSPEKVPNLTDRSALENAMRKFHWSRKNLTGIINVLAQALYSLFGAQDDQLRALQLGCFGYFQRGMTDGPMGLMGGLIPRPVILAYHFFSVAFLAIWMNACAAIATPLSIWKLPIVAVNAVLILWKACVVFAPVMYREGFQ